ncbi:MAG: tetratricopeptide repeat protein, partial [Treponema sp.]|nr:tetratricopeptide repeat protein [Treponema sp.]
IYAGRGQSALALDSLKKALPRTLDEGLKADVLYRIGKEYYYQGDYKNAIRSLQYSLNQDNGQNKVRNRARLILKQAQDKNK